MLCITPLEVVSFEGRWFDGSLTIQNNSPEQSVVITGWRQEGSTPPFDLSRLPLGSLDPWEIMEGLVLIRSPQETGEWSCELFAETDIGDILVPIRGFNKLRPVLVSPDFDLMEVML